MDGRGANAFAGNFMDAFNAGRDRSLRRDRFESMRDEQERNRTLRQEQFNFQKQQNEYQQGVTDMTRQANGLAYSGQLQGDAGVYGRDQQELESKYGFNPMNYVSPQAINYQTAAQKRQSKYTDAEVLAAINAKYSALGKAPKYDVIESDAGEQKYITKGSQIPMGWRVSKPAAININQGAGAIVGPGGVKLSATEVRDNRKSLNAAEGVNNSLNRLESLVDQFGWEPSTGFNSDTVATLDAAHRAVQMEMKELLNLGVLNGPDLELMDQMLVSPTAVPGNPLKWGSRKDAIKASYAEVRNFLNRKKKQHLANLGVTEQPQDLVTQKASDPLGIR